MAQFTLVLQTSLPGEWLDLDGLLNCTEEAMSQKHCIKAVIFLQAQRFLASLPDPLFTEEKEEL